MLHQGLEATQPTSKPPIHIRPTARILVYPHTSRSMAGRSRTHSGETLREQPKSKGHSGKHGIESLLGMCGSRRKESTSRASPRSATGQGRRTNGDDAVTGPSLACSTLNTTDHKLGQISLVSHHSWFSHVWRRRERLARDGRRIVLHDQISCQKRTIRMPLSQELPVSLLTRVVCCSNGLQTHSHHRPAGMKPTAVSMAFQTIKIIRQTHCHTPRTANDKYFQALCKPAPVCPLEHTPK